MLVAAITGNYGMGKSSVAAMFAECGAYTLDSDTIVADLLKRKAIIEKIRLLLGPDVLNEDKSLNKNAVADIIFHNTVARKKIETLLHPLVLHAVEDVIHKIESDERLVIVEVPLLFESGFQKRFCRTIAVYTNQKTALGRLRKKGVSCKDALARLHAQMDIRKKLRLADYVINNNGTKRQTMTQVKGVLKMLMEDIKKQSA